MNKYSFVVLSLTYSLWQQADALQLTKEQFLHNLLHSKNAEFFLSCSSKEPLKEVTFEFDQSDHMNETKFKAADGTDRILPLSSMFMTKRYQGKACIEGGDENGNIPLRNLKISLTRTFYTDEDREYFKKTPNPWVVEDKTTTYNLSDTEIDRLQKKNITDKYGRSRSRKWDFNKTAALLESLLSALAKNHYTFHFNKVDKEF